MNRIVLVAPRIPYGGAERQMVELKNAYKEEIKLVDLSQNISLDENGSQKSMNIIGPGLRNKLHRMRCMNTLYREYSTATDTVFIFYNSVFLWLAYFLRKKGHKVYISLREYNSDFLGAKYQFVLRTLNGVFTNTPRLYNDMQQLGINIKLTLNTISSASTTPNRAVLTRDNTKLLIVSNLEPHKQVLEVLAALKNEKYDIYIAGAMSNIAYTEKCRAIASVSSCKIHFLGSVSRDDLIQHYTTCACFIHASLVEGTSNAIVDAINFETPLIVGNTPENRYLVDDLPDFIWEDGRLDQLVTSTINHARDRSYIHQQKFLRDRVSLKFGADNLRRIRETVLNIS